MKSFFCVLGMLVTLGLCLLCVGFSTVGVTKIYALYHHDEWLTTEARLTSLRLDKGITGYAAEVECVYLVDGQSYKDVTTERIAGTDSDAVKREIVQKLGIGDVLWRDYPEGNLHKAMLRDDKNARAVVSYHPTFPSHAFYRGFIGEAFDHEKSLNMKVTGVFVALVMLFASGFYGCLRGLLRKKEKAPQKNSVADETQH
jgi:hypothetical protein